MSHKSATQGTMIRIPEAGYQKLNPLFLRTYKKTYEHSCQ
jgi:hypothetical protein